MRSRRGQVVPIASAALAATVTTLYLLQLDRLAALTIIPPLCWLLVGLILTAFGYSRKTRRRWLLSAGLWVLFTALCVDEVHGLMRWRRWDGGRQTSNERSLRVISLNCNTGAEATAAEVFQYGPDIVLYQESPSRAVLERLAHKAYGEDGSVLWGPDVSLIARGRIEPKDVDRGSHFAHAKVTLTTGATLEVLNLRLNPPVVRLDYWSPDCWRKHYENRLMHRKQIAAIVERINTLPSSAPILVGGDFNMPAGDGAFRPLEATMTDAYRVAGIGWGNTGLNHLPVVRVDQIWTNARLQQQAVEARQTDGSDHRMVICDMLMGED